jgi:hypothetical protein
VRSPPANKRYDLLLDVGGGEDAPIDLTDRRRPLLAINPICAVCDSKVTVIHGAGSRQTESAGTTLYRAFVWCRLLPCGHTFKIRAGGLNLK